MNRNDFLKNGAGFLGMALIAPSLLKSDNKNKVLIPFSNTDCKPTKRETAGPFPTKDAAAYERVDIREDREGVDLDINIKIGNLNANCAPMSDAVVDIWLCDKDGNYSQYNSSASDTFLRGRQITDRGGLVKFKSIFPGWYPGRAIHIHVHIYNQDGKSLLVTQIAFPEGRDSAVVAVNNSKGYKGMNGYTYSDKDGVFRDGVETELCTISGSLEEGYSLDHTIYVAGPNLSVSEHSKTEFSLAQNFPNPFTNTTTIPVTLSSAAKVSVSVFDLLGRFVAKPIDGKQLHTGKNDLEIQRGQLKSGYYIYKVTIENSKGTFEQSKKMLLN